MLADANMAQFWLIYVYAESSFIAPILTMILTIVIESIRRVIKGIKIEETLKRLLRLKMFLYEENTSVLF